MTANQACCACGGGTTNGTVAPSPTPAPTPVCIDDPVGWYDSSSPDYTCEWYGSKAWYCESYGDSWSNFGMTANQACCVCGGGSTNGTVTPSPTPAPTPVPTNNSTSNVTTCTDNPVGWYDIDGPFYNCTWYANKIAFNGTCGDTGDRWENFNTTANQACCVCGGGTSNFTSNISDNMHSYARKMVTKAFDYFYPENENDLEWQRQRHLKKY